MKIYDIERIKSMNFTHKIIKTKIKILIAYIRSLGQIGIVDLVEYSYSYWDSFLACPSLAGIDFAAVATKIPNQNIKCNYQTYWTFSIEFLNLPDPEAVANVEDYYWD